jgi:hypothetical protein
MCAVCADGLDKYFGFLPEPERMSILWSKTAFPFSHGEHTTKQLKEYCGAMLQGKDVCESCSAVKAPKHLITGNCRMCHKRAMLGYKRGFKPTTRQIEAHRNKFYVSTM